MDSLVILVTKAQVEVGLTQVLQATLSIIFSDASVIGPATVYCQSRILGANTKIQLEAASNLISQLSRIAETA